MQPVITLDIVHIAPGVYETHCDDFQASPTTHSSISDAIRYYGHSIPSSYSHFANIQYSGVSLGTRNVGRFLEEAEAWAQELVELVVDVNSSVAEIERMHHSHSSPTLLQKTNP